MTDLHLVEYRWGYRLYRCFMTRQFWFFFLDGITGHRNLEDDSVEGKLNL
jgi:hypothetical protein